MRILVIGDSHIPRRASEVPPIIQGMLNQLSSQLFDYTFFTGDLINAPNFVQFLKIHTKNDVFIVIGNMDYYGGNSSAPPCQKLILPIGRDEKINIGLIHGHQISPRGDHSQLELLALENDFNILISGHTHKDEIYLTDEGILLLNPGSVTGAWSFVASGKPSFMIIIIDEMKREFSIFLYFYESRDQKVREINTSFIMKDNKIRRKL